MSLSALFVSAHRGDTTFSLLVKSPTFQTFTASKISINAFQAASTNMVGSSFHIRSPVNRSSRVSLHTEEHVVTVCDEQDLFSQLSQRVVHQVFIFVAFGERCFNCTWRVHDLSLIGFNESCQISLPCRPKQEFDVFRGLARAGRPFSSQDVVIIAETVVLDVISMSPHSKRL